MKGTISPNHAKLPSGSPINRPRSNSNNSAPRKRNEGLLTSVSTRYDFFKLFMAIWRKELAAGCSWHDSLECRATARAHVAGRLFHINVDLIGEECSIVFVFIPCLFKFVPVPFGVQFTTCSLTLKQHRALMAADTALACVIKKCTTFENNLETLQSPRPLEHVHLLQA